MFIARVLRQMLFLNDLKFETAALIIVLGRMRIGIENKECLRGTGLETTFSHTRCTSYRSWVIPTVQRNQNWASRHSYSKHATCQSPGFACNQFYRRPMHCKEVVSWCLPQLEIYTRQ